MIRHIGGLTRVGVYFVNMLDLFYNYHAYNNEAPSEILTACLMVRRLAIHVAYTHNRAGIFIFSVKQKIQHI